MENNGTESDRFSRMSLVESSIDEVFRRVKIFYDSYGKDHIQVGLRSCDLPIEYAKTLLTGRINNDQRYREKIYFSYFNGDKNFDMVISLDDL
jgi:hypothetical protein